MRTIDASIYTLKDISQISIAKSFFDKLEVLGFQPDVISLWEPIRESYTKAKAIEYWTKEKDGIWDDERECFIGKAGNIP